VIPYADIIEQADRSWTTRLLKRLHAADLADDELATLVDALQAVSDPRSVGPLESILCDGERPGFVREAASAVLGGMQYLVLDVPQAKLCRWWHEGDLLLRRHALLCMGGIDAPDIVLQVASDPCHDLHADAIGRMTFFFELPQHEAIKIAALSHTDPKVRAAAASVLLWDEPVAAELPLIQATGDPVPEGAAEAANTLAYYPSLKTIRCLHGLLDHPNDKVRQEALESYQEIRGALLSHLRDKDRRVAEWLRPVWDLLAFTEQELLPEEDESPSARRQEPSEVKPVADLLALLADADSSPRVLGELFWSHNWRASPDEDRRRLRPVLLTHPDPLVRERAALCLEAWQDVPGLVELVRDSDLGVCKAAMYRLGQLSPAAGIAALAWEHLHRKDVLGVHATETLDTFVRHADANDAVRRLGWIAGDHGYQEGLRVAAISHLADLGASEVVGQLAGLLAEPPEITWALHIALLDAIAELGLPRPDIGHLRNVDNLHVQTAVARCCE
jgi:HEAT repeat protein